MKIAVNTRFLIKGRLEGYGYFIAETLLRIAINHPNHQFYFIFDKTPHNDLVFPENVEIVVLGPAARHPLLWKYWYDIRVPAFLKKCKADVFVSPDGFCSLNTKVPQCLVIHDLAYLHFPSFLKKSHLLYYKRYIPKFLSIAKRIITVSEFSKKDILTHFPAVEPDRIDVVYSAAKNIFKPLSVSELELTKEKYTAGKEYFLYTGSIHPRKNLLNLLKAFSIFKKRLQSGTKLVITGRLAWKYESFISNLNSYKYRNDVVLTGYLPEEDLVKVTAAAYAMVYPSFHEGFGVPVLEAMRARVPVITSTASAMQEIAGEAALYADPADPSALAEQMMQVYKNEDLRDKITQLGIIRESGYSWDRTSQLLWHSILATVD